MPIVRSLLDSLIARYGERKGEEVYFSMEASGRGPFAPGGKYHDQHVAWATRNGVRPVGTKKPRTSAKRKPGAKRRR